MKEVETIGMMFLDFMQHPEHYDKKLFYDNDYITDGVIFLKKGLILPVDEVAKQKATKLKVDTYLSDVIKDKGQMVGTFDIRERYDDCEYYRSTHSAIIPVEKDLGWYIDSRWLDWFDNQFAINEIRYYSMEVEEKDGCIFEVVGWNNGDEYTDKPEEILGYILGVAKQ